jgi:hypothetical protein
VLPLLGVGLLLGACAGGGRAAAGPAVPRGVPGFDTREYPGDAVMATWLRESPYRWVGYYLDSPCRPASPWAGKRAELERQGWGVAVLYVGEQQWADTTSYTPTAGERMLCTRANLTAEQGRADGEDAARAAGAEGFAAGTVVFLDVERVDSVGAGLAAYVRTWTRSLLEGGRYRPGLYAHAENVAALYALLMSEFTSRGLGTGPAVWVARSGNFDLAASPRESGHPYARVWQGRLDIEETWGGARLRIDANVADSASPSSPPDSAERR